ncbi:MAG: CoA transferase [Gammaproteobacteria bacterium]|nr:CoA transferase [Gammaproteobacteria bacterium]MBT5202901.1 CoA transferase [Gammaproteobacteria bacterium]MBT5602405.1 CoA transferase [Gammaproteobacteria bacterium]MBT6245193.1 CoA transferase [Gammaproteobacteria bacterium]
MKPLSHIKVLDLTLARAGPTAVRLLADWGAQVTRIEPPAKTASGDLSGARHSPDSQNLHRNKRGLCLNLKAPEGLGVFLKLVAQADVVVENFRRDVKHRLKIDYDSLKKINPKIIYGSISGFGQTGPYSERPGVDQIVQGTSGLMSITGDKNGEPTRVGIAISDTSAGMFLGQGILLALIARDQTGEGQWVHTSLLESMLCKLDFQGARYTMSGDVPARAGNHHPTNSPMGVFEAQDGQVNLAASSNKMFANLCRVISAEALLQDQRFVKAAGRIQHRTDLTAEINSRTCQMSVAELVTKLNDAGCPCGPIYDIGEAFEDEQAQSLKMTRTANHPVLGNIDLIRSPINFAGSAYETSFSRPAPELGEHTDEILIEAGISEDEISALRQAKVI